MDFGLVDHTLLDSIDFRLPAEPGNNKIILPGKKNPDPKIYIGLPRWGRKEWVGQLYPLKAKAGDYLHYYAAHFNMVELNATHYTFYSEQQTGAWSNSIGNKEFKFCPKLHKDITHAGPLYAKDLVLEKFIEGIRGFEDHLGPMFIQLSESYSSKKKNDLFNFLDMLPKDLAFFLEVRHPDWFVPAILDQLVLKLASHKVGFIITDTAGRRDVAHMHLTVPNVFIRFVTNNLHPSDFDRTDAWAKRINHWIEQGMEEIYFVIHMRDEEYSLDLVKYAIDKINEICKLNLPPLNLIR